MIVIIKKKAPQSDMYSPRHDIPEVVYLTSGEMSSAIV